MKLLQKKVKLFLTIGICLLLFCFLISCSWSNLNEDSNNNQKSSPQQSQNDLELIEHKWVNTEFGDAYIEGIAKEFGKEVLEKIEKVNILDKN
jgi:hypothetical protein